MGDAFGGGTSASGIRVQSQLGVSCERIEVRVGMEDDSSGAQGVPPAGPSDLFHLEPGSALVALVEWPTAVLPTLAGDTTSSASGVTP